MTILPGLIALILLAAPLQANDAMEQTKSGCLLGGCFPQRQLPPEALVRVVNQYDKGGSVRQDKGSGTLIEEDERQWILTAAHIFREGIGRVFVTTQSGEKIDAEVAVRNTLYDFVLLKLNRRLSLRPISVANKPTIQGEPCIGWGFGQNGKLQGQPGTVAGYAMTNKSQTHETLKTTGRAREGDSGGAILNEKGELIGLLWGTDGQYTYSTYCGRLQKIIDELKHDKEPGTERSAVPEYTPPKALPPQYIPFHPPPTTNITPVFQTSLIEKTALALGYTTPPSMLLYYILRHIFVRKIKNRIKKAKQPVGLNDDYAKQLTDLYELSGRSTTADATLGRLYERKLCEAEESSGSDMANFAKKLRKQVADQFLRIHSANPNPTE